MSIVKRLGIAAVLLAAIAASAAAKKASAAEHGVIYSGKIDRAKMVLADNHKYAKNYQFIDGMGDIFPGDYKAKRGDVIKLHFKGKVDKPIIVGKGDGPHPISYFYCIVDTCQAANYWTKLHAEDDSMFYGKEVDDVIEINMNVTLTRDSRATAKGGGSSFVVGTSEEQKTPVNITVSEFTYEITRP